MTVLEKETKHPCRECKLNISDEEAYIPTPTGDLHIHCFAKIMGEEIEKHPIWSPHE